MRRLRNVDVADDKEADDKEADAGVADEHGIDSWLRRLRFDEGSDGAGSGGGAGLVA